MPVEPEPIFIVEGDGWGRYVTDEGEVITGCRALLSERNTLCEVAFVPHWKNCPETGHFQHGVREFKVKRDAEGKAKGQMSMFCRGKTVDEFNLFNAINNVGGTSYGQP